MKNPYDLINKANSTFDLYLEKFSEFEKFMDESRDEWDKLNILFLKFMDESRDENKEITSQISDFKKESFEVQSELNNLISDFKKEYSTNINELFLFNDLCPKL